MRRIDTLRCELTSSHWGAYEIGRREGKVVELRAWAGDPEPSPIGFAMLDAYRSPLRVQRPAVRASFLAKGAAADGGGRGCEPFVEVSWDRALDLVAGELKRVIGTHGNSAVFGGSYGWSSAGRFHHAQSQIHRFLNVAGGYTRSVRNYSFAAADTILPYVIGDNRGLALGHTTWSGIADHAQTLVAFGGVSQKNSQVSAGGMARHGTMSALAAFRRNGGHLVSVSPIADDSPLEPTDRWLPVRPGTDVALMLGLAHTLLVHGLHDEEFLARCTSGFERFCSYLDGSEDRVERIWRRRVKHE